MMIKVLVGIGAALVVCVTVAVPASAKPADKVATCHLDEDTGTYELLSINTRMRWRHMKLRAVVCLVVLCPAATATRLTVGAASNP